MQTFLPYESFYRSAEILDARRLGKQRVEALQILQALSAETSGWRNHPAVRMWKGYEGSLADYGIAICRVWKNRGHEDNCCGKLEDYLKKYNYVFEHPHWLGNPYFHLSHQSNLIRKDSKHYGPLFPGVQDNLPYIWPII
jgi:hypothetical protein